ncbi:glycosyl transferase family 41-domain-containing protein [Lipomyces orientalis]|uniref:Glycosyl transferase family 41-domain-containing protein n=1 Tax=Lipomyces orientalis TaxID=1233043 RepID=A0ACC3TP57_9ASCO
MASSTTRNARLRPPSPLSPHLIPADNAPTTSSLQQLLAHAHDRYAAHPHSTSREELWRVLTRLDEWTTKMVEYGYVQPVVHSSGATQSHQHHHHQQQQQQQQQKRTSSILEAWLLGGCIAYSLGDMNRAIEWNYRILRVDPNYVESMSNLAAALRALRRNSEAEVWWTRAVRLRPTYWDAADHLFSLLCAQHRYADAANVLAYVEQHAVPTAVPAADLARYLAIIHAKGTLLYALGNHVAAADAFARVLALAAGYADADYDSPDSKITLARLMQRAKTALASKRGGRLLLTPQEAQACLSDVFDGDLPGVRSVADAQHRQSIAQTTANTLLTLAKILQDAIAAGVAGGGDNTNANQQASTDGKTANASTLVQIIGRIPTAFDVLPLYYLSLALHPSPSTANNIGILLASLAPALPMPAEHSLALEYYRYGLSLDSRHPHLYTNLGSLLKDQGRLAHAVAMYERAVACDPNFDIALANLANAVKDQGRVAEAIGYYRRAVAANPGFDEAACGLSNALNSVCDWTGRGSCGVELRGVDADGNVCLNRTDGWMARILSIIDTQLSTALAWGRGIIGTEYAKIVQEIVLACGYAGMDDARLTPWLAELVGAQQSGQDEGAKLVELIEVAARRARWRWYNDLYGTGHVADKSNYHRPHLPESLPLPAAPTVLPFHTFTIPFTALQVREICRRTALRVSVTSARYHWLPKNVYPPPPPPNAYLKVGYISSDFNNHPLSHLMQSVFGLHRQSAGTSHAVYGICYATTPSDGTSYRQKVEMDAHEFVDVSGWSTQAVVERIVRDGIHVLVNLNGFTRGARNEIFACRPAPLSIAFMGFAGSLGAEWSDYILADRITMPPSAVRHQRPENRDRILRHHNCVNQDSWAYFEDVVFCKNSFFCCDHRQSAPDAEAEAIPADDETRWKTELQRRDAMRADLFPNLAPGTIILANFNQLYKIDPSIFVTWLRILARVPNAILWLLKFPDLGSSHLQSFAERWAGPEVACRVIFTEVAGKDTHLLRSRVPDLFLDTPECNAHTTATDVIWAGTPILTFPRYDHKMCSRIAASVVVSASTTGAALPRRLIASSEAEYEERAVELCAAGGAAGELLRLRKELFLGRSEAAIFDTSRWTRDIEKAYWMMWDRWVRRGGTVTIGEDEDRNLYL